MFLQLGALQECVAVPPAARSTRLAPSVLHCGNLNELGDKCGALLAHVIHALHSHTDLMHFSNENYFCAVYSTLLYLDGMLYLNAHAFDSLRQVYVNTLADGFITNISASTPASIVHVLEKIEHILVLPKRPSSLAAVYTSQGSIFRL